VKFKILINDIYPYEKSFQMIPNFQQREKLEAKTNDFENHGQLCILVVYYSDFTTEVCTFKFFINKSQR